jgi:hypothetical protein
MFAFGSAARTAVGAINVTAMAIKMIIFFIFYTLLTTNWIIAVALIATPRPTAA